MNLVKCSEELTEEIQSKVKKVTENNKENNDTVILKRRENKRRNILP